MFSFEEWLTRFSLKPVTKDVLEREDLNTKESLCRLSPSLIDTLDITLGQKLLLKDAVLTLKNMDTYTSERKESAQPSATADNAQPGASGCCTKPIMRKSFGQLTLTFDGKLGPELSDSVDERAEEESYRDLATEEIDKKSKIYYNVQSGKMFDYHTAINNASKELCRSNPALLADRKNLFEKARKMVHEKGYSYKRKKSRSYDTLEPCEKKREKHLSSEIRVKRMNELSEDLSEIDVEIRLQTQQREKYKNINELNKAIGSTEKLSDLRQRKRKLQSELTVLQLKDAKVKKAKKSAEKKKEYESKQPETQITIKSFLRPITEEKVKATEKKTEVSESTKSAFDPEKTDAMEPDVVTPAAENIVEVTEKKTEKKKLIDSENISETTETQVSESAKCAVDPEQNSAIEPDVLTPVTEDKVEITEKKTEKKKLIDSENISETTETQFSESEKCAVDPEQNATIEPDNFQ